MTGGTFPFTPQKQRRKEPTGERKEALETMLYLSPQETGKRSTFWTAQLSRHWALPLSMAVGTTLSTHASLMMGNKVRGSWVWDGAGEPRALGCSGVLVKIVILPGPSGLVCSSSWGSLESTLDWAGWGHLGSSEGLLIAFSSTSSECGLRSSHLHCILCK